MTHCPLSWSPCDNRIASLWLRNLPVGAGEAVMPKNQRRQLANAVDDESIGWLQRSA